MPIPGTLQVTAKIAPTADTDVYPTHDDQYALGGWRVVADIGERDAITTQRRKEGMRVRVIATGLEYTLEADLVTWTAADPYLSPDNVMLKTVYDTDDDGIVDDSERLGGELPDYYLDLGNANGSLPQSQVTGLTTSLSNKLNTAEVGVSVAQLVGGVVPNSQLPFLNSQYKGLYNGATNVPLLTNGIGTAGDFYITTVAGSAGPDTVTLNQIIVYDGAIWSGGPDFTGGVNTVNGKPGPNPVLNADDIAETATRFWQTSLQNDAADAAEAAGASAANRYALLSDISGTAGGAFQSTGVFVSKTGNDGTAEPHNITKPYLTIDAAYAAAVAGDTIVVFPGDYELSAGLQLDNRNISFEFLGKGTLTLDVAVNEFLFTDVPSASATDCVINGPGWTFSARGYNAGSPMTNGVIDMHKASRIVFNADKILAEDSALCLEGAEVAGTYTITPELIINANYISTTVNDRQGPIYAQTGPILHVTAEEVNCTARSDYYSGPVFTDLCSYVNLNIDRVINNGATGCALRMADSFAQDIYYANVNYLESDAGWTIYMEGIATDIWISGEKLVSNSDCCVVATGTTIHVDGFTVVSTYVTGPDGILHAEVGGTLYAKNVTIERAAGVTGGYDILTSGAGAEMYLLNTQYDLTKTNKIFFGDVYTFNGTNYALNPEIINPPNPTSGNTISSSKIIGGTIDYNSNTGCTIDSCILVNTDIAFLAPGTIQNEVWLNNIMMSPPPLQSLAYGATLTVTRPVDLQVGETGTGAVTIDLPVSGMVAQNYVIISDYGANCSTYPITVDAGTNNEISGDVIAQSYIMNTNGQSVRFRLVDDTPGAFRWKAEIMTDTSSVNDESAAYVTPQQYGAVNSTDTFADQGLPQSYIDANYPGIGATTTDTIDWAAMQYCANRAIALKKPIKTYGTYYLNQGVSVVPTQYKSMFVWEGAGARIQTTNNNTFTVIAIADQVTSFSGAAESNENASIVVENMYHISDLDILVDENQTGFYAGPSFSSIYTGILVTGDPGAGGAAATPGELGIHARFNLNATFLNCHIRGCTYGMRLESGDGVWTSNTPATTSNTQCNHTVFQNCRVQYADATWGSYGERGFEVIDCSGVSVKDCILEGTRIKQGIYQYSELTTVLNLDISNTHYECTDGTRAAGNSEALLYSRTLGAHITMSRVYGQYASILADTGISSGGGSCTVHLSDTRYWVLNGGNAFYNAGNTTYISSFNDDVFLLSASWPALIAGTAVTLCGGVGCGNNKYSHYSVPR